MIQSVLALRAKAGREQEIEDLYRERGVLDRSVRFPGCRAATLLRCTDGGPSTHLVIADWDDADAYRRWVADPWRATISGELTALLDIEPGEPVIGGLYEPVISNRTDRPTTEELS
ncbi:antibiotic biosynthesis monooxygenase family protein [Actinomadura sp. HBU206391]|uniref:antibiotic biosynthesis monooxygenase family protein n=1 Tax=Actinomadura sp. HBU206391 TaxID=2731692 RepID=UPI00164FAAFB|nr:antibiotic biosynthesis monooxygenase family protein [Actinomadura sp. HBU206391]MBC6463425.1 antibiotic biosynthesis monooxygenase [Actinomadura sp. HBU206391]